MLLKYKPISEQTVRNIPSGENEEYLTVLNIPPEPESSYSYSNA